MGIFKTLTVGGTTFELAPAISEVGGLEFNSKGELKVKTNPYGCLKPGADGLYLDLQSSHTINDTQNGLEVKFNPYTMYYGSGGLEIYYNDYLFDGSLKKFCNGAYMIADNHVAPPTLDCPTPLGLAAFDYGVRRCLGVSLWGNDGYPMVFEYSSGVSSVAPLAFVSTSLGGPFSIGVPIYYPFRSAVPGVNPIQMGAYGLYIDCYDMAACVAGFLRTSDDKPLVVKSLNE